MSFLRQFIASVARRVAECNTVCYCVSDNEYAVYCVLTTLSFIDLRNVSIRCCSENLGIVTIACDMNLFKVIWSSPPSSPSSSSSSSSFVVHIH